MVQNVQFQPGPRLIDGSDLNRAINNPLVSFLSGITATPAGTVANSVLITETFSQIDTVASAADGVALPAAAPGVEFTLVNAGANAMQVFARGGSTINAAAGATGLSQAAGTTAIYICARQGQWRRILTA